MFRLPVMMRKDAIVLRKHAPQTLGKARICTCFTCFIRTSSGDGTACEWLFQSVRHYLIAIDNTTIDSVVSTQPHFPLGLCNDYLERSKVMMLRVMPLSAQSGIMRHGVNTTSCSPCSLKERVCLVPTHSGFQATSTLVVQVSPTML